MLRYLPPTECCSYFTIYIYFGGHGCQEDTKTYWVAHDSQIDDLRGTGISSHYIQHSLGQIRANRIVTFLDCCYAAATAHKKNPSRAVLTQEEQFAAFKGNGRLTISSSDGYEKSVEMEDYGHGAFTYFLLKGLQGEADRNNDGIVDADELWTYLNKRVSEAARERGNTQTPRLSGDIGHDFPLTLNANLNRRKEAVIKNIYNLIGEKIQGEYPVKGSEVDFLEKIWRNRGETENQQRLYKQIEDWSADKIPTSTLISMLRVMQKNPGEKEKKYEDYKDKLGRIWHKSGKAVENLTHISRGRINVLVRNKFIAQLNGTGDIGTNRDDRFTACDDGTVSDISTGLMWASTDNGEDINWHNAKKYCEDFRGGGHSDWRMPTLDELKTLSKTETINQDKTIATKFIVLTEMRVWSFDKSASNDAKIFFFRTENFFTDNPVLRCATNGMIF